MVKITQRIVQVLDINYHLHSSWRPQSSGKVEKAKHTVKKILVKLCQGTSDTWFQLLPIALLRYRGAPKSNLELSPFAILHRKPFLTSDIYFDTEIQKQFKYCLQSRTGTISSPFFYLAFSTLWSINNYFLPFIIWSMPFNLLFKFLCSRLQQFHIKMMTPQGFQPIS